MSEGFVKNNNIKIRKGPRKRLEFAEGTVTYVDNYVDASAQIGSSAQSLEALVAPITNDVLLGLKWLRQVNPKINWVTGSLTFDDQKSSSPATTCGGGLKNRGLNG